MSSVDGNVCGCRRMVFSVQDIAFSDPEEPKVTCVLGDLFLATCLGCGQKLLMGKGQYRFIPCSPTSSAGREILSDSISRAQSDVAVEASAVTEAVAE